MLRKLDVLHIFTGRHVLSRDPRKKAVVAAFKARVEGCRKVTQVAEASPGVFHAMCMGTGGGRARGGAFEKLGCFELTLPEYAAQKENS